MHLNLALALPLVSLISAIPIDRLTNLDPSYNYCQAPVPTDYKPLDNHELEKVLMFIRHGDRNSIFFLPNDNQVWNVCNQQMDTTDYDNSTNISNKSNKVAIQERVNIPDETGDYDYVLPQGNCLIGELTDKGKWQHNYLGSTLRNIYVDQMQFLPEDLDINKLFVRSTHFWRTRKSAHSLLTGLYPNGSESNAISILTRPAEVENLSNNPTACPVYKKYEKEAKEEPEWKQLWEETKPVFDHINDLLETPKDSDLRKRWGNLYDVLWTRICHGFPLPCSPSNRTNCVTRDEADLAMKMASREIVWLKRDSAVHKKIDMAYLGALMAEVRQEMETPTVPFTLYSAHDDTLATLLGMFQMEGMQWPPYASNLIFEIWKNNDKGQGKVVRALFNGKVIVPKNAQPCKDMSQCPLDKFNQFIGSFVPNNMPEFCEYKG